MKKPGRNCKLAADLAVSLAGPPRAKSTYQNQDQEVHLHLPNGAVDNLRYLTIQ